MNEHGQHPNVPSGRPTDEQILVGVRRHMSDVESQLPLPPLWQPSRRSTSVSESPNPVRVSFRPSAALGLGGLALVAIVVVIGALILGPLAGKHSQAGGQTGPTTTITYSLVHAGGTEVSTADLDATVQILKTRASAMGLTGVAVTALSPGQVEVKIGGTPSADAIKQLGQTGKLEFVLLPRDVYGYFDMAAFAYVPGTAAYAKPVPNDGDAIDPTLPAQFNGDQLDRSKAAAKFDAPTNGWVVTFAFNAEAAARFETWSGQHVGDYFAIVVDGEVISAPYIKSAITGGSGQISGGFTEESAKGLAAVLQSGTLPLPLQEVSVETSGHTQAGQTQPCETPGSSACGSFAL